MNAPMRGTGVALAMIASCAPIAKAEEVANMLACYPSTACDPDDAEQSEILAIWSAMLTKLPSIPTGHLGIEAWADTIERDRRRWRSIDRANRPTPDDFQGLDRAAEQ